MCIKIKGRELKGRELKAHGEIVPLQDSCWRLASPFGSSAESGMPRGSRDSNNSSNSSSLTRQLALAAADMQGQQLTSKIARYRALTLSKG
jgi:hypothetical protein